MPDAKRIAALEREAEALRVGVERYLDGTYPRAVGEHHRRDGEPSPKDHCEHGRPVSGACEECLQRYFRSVLAGTNVETPE